MKKNIIILNILSALILNSCSKIQVELNSMETQSTNHITNTQNNPHPTSDFVNELPAPMLESTLEAYPTPISVFSYPGQVADGKLLFYVEELDKVCHDIKEPINIQLVFRNLTAKTLKIVDNISIASNQRGEDGNVIPILTTKDGEDIYTLADISRYDVFNSSFNTYFTLYANKAYTLVDKYYFPRSIVQSVTGEIVDLITPSSGRYFLRFVYTVYQRDLDTWYGEVSSNRIEVCVIH